MKNFLFNVLIAAAAVSFVVVVFFANTYRWGSC
jgi:F0F1-type ATP synthase membrane subunit b/b'